MPTMLIRFKYTCELAMHVEIKKIPNVYEAMGNYYRIWDIYDLFDLVDQVKILF